MGKIISLDIKIDNEKVWVLKNLMKFSSYIFMEFYHKRSLISIKMIT